MTDDRPVSSNDLARALGIETWQDARDARDALKWVNEQRKEEEKSAERVVSGWWQIVIAAVSGAVTYVLTQIKWGH